MNDQDREEFERRVGTRLCGRWTLEKLLGVGGMAAVYAGVNGIGKRAAIKILHPEIARSKELRHRLEQEGRAVNDFQHPGAVTIHEFDTSEDGTPFLVMELLEGESLSDRANRLGGIEAMELLRLIDGLLDVLAAAHAKEIIHRDIKLDNLFLCEDGRLKVLDFGIARMRQHAQKTMRTRPGATLGTVSYMAPEQVKGGEIDRRADIFAVGATMFRVLARRRIHEATNDSELLVKMATQPAPPLASVAKTVPAGVALVVDRALAFERSRRYPDAPTMQADIRALLQGQPPPYASARRDAGDLPWTMDGPTPMVIPVSEPVRSAPSAGTSGPSDPTAAPRPGAGTSGPSDPTAAPRPVAGTSGPSDPTVIPRPVAASFAAPAPPPADSSTQVSFTAPVMPSSRPAPLGYEEAPASAAPRSALESVGLASASPTRWQIGTAPVSRVLGPHAPPRPGRSKRALIAVVAGLFFLIGIGIAITLGMTGRGDEAGAAYGPPVASASPLTVTPDPSGPTADPTVPAASASGAAAPAPRPGAPSPAPTGGTTPEAPGAATGGGTTARPPSATPPPPTSTSPSAPPPAAPTQAGTSRPPSNDDNDDDDDKQRERLEKERKKLEEHLKKERERQERREGNKKR